MSFEEELEYLITKYSKENDANTPNFLLADYINNCLNNFSNIIMRRDNWFGFHPFASNQTITNEPNNIIEVEEILKNNKRRLEFNTMELKNIIFKYKNEVITVDKKILDDWEYAGLSNCDFIETFDWKNKKIKYEEE